MTFKVRFICHNYRKKTKYCIEKEIKKYVKKILSKATVILDNFFSSVYFSIFVFLGRFIK